MTDAPDCARYALLASAIAGRTIHVARGEGSTFTDGRTIFMAPESPGAAADGVLGLVVQAGLVAGGSLEPRLLARLVGRRTPARRFLTLEAHRTIRRRELCAPGQVRERVLDHWSGPASSSAGESLDRAIDDPSVPGAPEHFGILRPSVVLRDVAVGRGHAPKDDDSLDSVQPSPIEELNDDEDSDDSAILKLFSSPFQRESTVSRFLREQILRTGRGPAADDGGGGELGVSRTQSVTAVGPQAKRVNGARPAARRDAPPTGTHAYPEWDDRRRAYRPDWCHVAEYDPAPATATAVSAFGRDAGLEHRLARLGLALQRHRRRPDGDALDLEALLDLAVSRRIGEPPSELIHEARLNTGHDLGVVVLLDASGSTASSAAGRHSVWEDQRRLTAHLVAALEAVGERVAAYGFRTHGRHDVRFLRIKDFENRFDGAARARLATLEPSGFTRLGAAVRHAAHLAVERSGTSRPLVILVSDGLPYEEDYRDRHAEQDSCRAFAESITQGVACACVSVGPSADITALDRVWGESSSIRLDRIQELSNHIDVLLRTALRHALAAGRPA